MTMQQTNDTLTAPKTTIGQEAAQWLICLSDPDPIPDDPYYDPSVRNRAFSEWVLRSPAHLRAFFEIVQFKGRIQRLDTDVFSDGPLVADAYSTTVAVLPTKGSLAPEPPAAAPAAHPHRLWMWFVGALAAGCSVVVLFTHQYPTSAQTYTTRIGEEQQFQLRDGSVAQLNTNSQIEVTYFWTARSIRLLRGEAFFTVTHEFWRPFIVDSGGATVRAVGTEFDVRSRPQATDVVVVSGTVKVGAPPIKATGGKDTGPPPKVGDSPSAATMLTSGESAEIAHGRVTKKVGVNINEALSWRTNRVVFSNRRLADAADEINRYNLAQIRVEDSRARETRVSGVFPGARVKDFIVVAQQISTLSVVPDGANWVIRSRR
jgi:ferric-dicitrate binding protein FerR (iron transport regulator)